VLRTRRATRMARTDKRAWPPGGARSRKAILSELARNRGLAVLVRMRTEGKSLTGAIREVGTSKRTVVRYVGSALIQEPRGRYRAKPSDRFRRSLHFLTAEGQISITLHGSRLASKVAEYWAAVDHYLKTGEAARLKPFVGKTIRAGKQFLPFITDPRILNRIANAGEVSFEDLYAISN
jgi:hypothetical protein